MSVLVVQQKDKTSHWWTPLVVFLVVMISCFSAVIMVGGIWLTTSVIHSQKDPPVDVLQLTSDQYTVTPDGNVVIELESIMRRSCVAQVARGFTRVDPRDPNPANPTHIDIQILTSAPSVSGVFPSDLRPESNTPSITQIPTTAKRRDGVKLHISYYFPSPSSMATGPGWHFAELISQEACGPLWGLMPKHTVLAIGPEVALSPKHNP